MIKVYVPQILFNQLKNLFFSNIYSIISTFISSHIMELSLFGVNRLSIKYKMKNQLGTVSNPISLDDEEETNNQRQVILDAARNKSIIEQALLSSQPLDLCFAVIKTNIQGDLPTKQRELNKAIVKYFKKKIDINISCEHFHPRIEPDYSDAETMPNPCELLLYGVDFLTTKLIIDRFTLLNTQIRQIVWINDSTCKLIYGSATEAELVIQQQTKTVKIQQDSCALPKGWFLIQNYMVFNFQRLLWLRYATTKQGTIQKENKQSYQKFAKAKAQIGKYLLDQFKAADKYRMIVQDLQNKKMMERSRHRNNDRSHNYSRTREKYRDHSRFRRQFQEDRREPRNLRRRYDDQQFEMNEVRQARPAHRPANMNESYEYNSNNRNRFNEGRDPNTSFRNEGRQENKEYLDFQRDPDTSFRFNHHQRSFNRNDLSFQMQESKNKRRCYDVPEVDSEMSFNQFGAAGRENDERDDFHCDYNYLQKRPNVGVEEEASFMMNQERPRRGDNNTSFMFNQNYANKNTNNQSFEMDINPRANNGTNESFVMNPIPKKNQRADQQDFFEFLNSNVSSVREVNEEDFHDNSFAYAANNNKQNKILSESFYNQDSY